MARGESFTEGNAVEGGRDTRGDKGDFESTIAAVQHSRTAEVGLGALARTARSCSSIQQWRRKIYQQVWDTQTQTHKRIKRMNNNEDIKEKKMTDERITNTKAILKKMTENKKLMKMKVDKDKVVVRKTSKSKSQNKGKGRIKRE